MKRNLLYVAITVALLTLVTPTAAAESGWHLRVFAAGHDSDLDVVVPAENPDEVRIRSDSDLGFGASLEYQFTKVIGIELGYMQASPAIVLIAEDIPGYGDISLTDSMSTRAITLDLDVHLTPSSPYFDFYIGAGFASMGYGDLRYAEPDGDTLELNISNDIGYSAKAGLDIALGKNSNWAAIGGIRYIWTDLEATQTGDPDQSSLTLDFNTFSFSVGIAYSF
jgi:outer membrane protein W